MFTISNNYFTNFDAEVNSGFMKRLNKYVLEKYYNDLQVDESAISKRVYKAVFRAQRYGFKHEDDVAVFVEADMTFGEEFEESVNNPWAKQLLNDKRTEVSMKSRNLELLMTEYLENKFNALKS